MISTTNELKDLIVKSLEEKKAENIIVLPLSDQIPLAKYMIFASGRSVKNIKAIAEYVSLELKHKTSWPAQIEGFGNADWVLLDAGDIIVHIFHPEARERFKLEELWGKRVGSL